jgi:hypothetical protein
MKRLETLLKQIDKAEKEIYQNYSDTDIYEAVNKLEKRGHSFGNTSLVSVIFNGAYDNIRSWLEIELYRTGMPYGEMDNMSIEQLMETKKEIDKKC